MPALAGGAVFGHVTQVRVDKDGHGIVFFDVAVGGTPPACVTAPYLSALAFNMADAGGKAILAVALQAKATGAALEAYGTGVCGIYPAVMEDWFYGKLQ